MDDLRAATVDEVVLAWLRAEIDSDRFKEKYIGPNPAAALVAAAHKLVFEADLNSAVDNAKRRAILGIVRGFGHGTYIFTGLADDITWRRMRLAANDIGDMRYANHVETWTVLAPATLTVSEGAGRVATIQPRDPTYDYIVNLAKAIHDSPVPLQLPEIVCLSRPGGGISVMEGHSRATAMVMEAAKYPQGIELYLGSGPSAATWAYL